jgi:hypothetical protein
MEIPAGYTVQDGCLVFAHKTHKNMDNIHILKLQKSIFIRSNYMLVVYVDDSSLFSKEDKKIIFWLALFIIYLYSLTGCRQLCGALPGLRNSQDTGHAHSSLTTKTYWQSDQSLWSHPGI